MRAHFAHLTPFNGCAHERRNEWKRHAKYFVADAYLLLYLLQTTERTERENEMQNESGGSSTFKDFSFHKETIKLNCYFSFLGDRHAAVDLRMMKANVRDK